MKSKKIVFIVLAFVCFSSAMHSQQSVDRIFTEFAKEKGVVRIGLGKFTMTLASLFTNVMGVDGIEVLSFDECNPLVKERLNTAIASLKDNSYETMVSVNEETERTKILVKTDGNSIRELIVMTSGNDPALVRIKGKIKPSDIENVINKNR